MLVELEIRDFAIIDHLRLRLAPGFNVLTGETGAGKSIIVGAVGQLLGERADSESVRAGAERAIIEGVFEAGATAGAVREVLEAHGIDEDPVLIMTREIHAAGRSTGRVNGRAVPIRVLSEIGQLLIDVHGQSENASLKREGEHLLLLDRYAGLEDERLALGQMVRVWRDTRQELAALQENEAERERQLDSLRFQAEEIAAVAPSVAEEEQLLSERLRLANAERLAQLAETAYLHLRGDETVQGGALDALDEAIVALDDLAAIDQSMAAAVEPLRAALDGASETATLVRDYREGLDFDPGRLEEVEERLGAFAALKRKYGQTLDEVLAHGERADAELGAIEGDDARRAKLEERVKDAAEEIGRAAARLSERRFAAGERLAGSVATVLEELGMPGAVFEVSRERRLDPAGVPVEGDMVHIDQTGVDQVAFRVSTNPGEPPRRLVQVASGGETARIMLALKSILTAADRIPTLIFDEIDAGIGGRIGAVVGRKLDQLATGHQVLCVTHLPQVAAFGTTHVHVRKVVNGGRTTTAVGRLEGEERLDELEQMLGGGGSATRDAARQLLESSGARGTSAASTKDIDTRSSKELVDKGEHRP